MKKKHNFQNFEFVDDLYRSRYQLCVGNPDEMEDYMNSMYDVTLSTRPHDVDGMQFSIVAHKKTNSNKIFFVYLKKGDDYNTMAHELIHLVAEVFLDKGVNVDLEKDQESFAYYHSYLMDVFMKKIKESKKRLTKKK